MDASYADVYPELYKHHWWWRVREEILLSKIAGLLVNASGHARILDVGCGAGLFFDALERFGHVEGIESDASAITRAGRWSSRIVAGELDASYRPTQPFDLILVLDVIEHIHDPTHLLRRAGEILTPSGRIVVTVPAFDWIWTAHDDMNHHVRRYTAGQLRSTLHRAGLIALETRYLFQSLVGPKLLIRAKEALISTRPQVPQVPTPVWNAGLRVWCRAEYLLAGWLPFGSSLMAVATGANRQG